jgi:hypothetical protein
MFWNFKTGKSRLIAIYFLSQVKIIFVILIFSSYPSTVNFFYLKFAYCFYFGIGSGISVLYVLHKHGALKEDSFKNNSPNQA